jgi:DNA-binding transcriptional ArsR family regulator
MLAATRTQGRPGVPTATPPTGPQVRDLASPSAGFTVEWDVRSLYDFLFSLTGDAGATDDLPEADRTWLREARAGLAPELTADVEELFGAQLCIFLAAFVVEHPEMSTVDELLELLDTVPTRDLVATVLRDFAHDPELAPLVERASAGDVEAREALRAAGGGHKDDLLTLLDDPATTHRRLVRVLQAWAVPFATIEPRIRAIQERDAALRAPDRGAYSGSELIERTTGGIRWLPEVGIRRVILAPSYFSRPYNYLLAGDGWRFFGYPVADDALDVEDRLAPPPAMVRLHRALGDETRLRILKLLAGQDLYLTEIAQQLELSKPTIKHHLALLRSAGLVTVIEAGSVIYYNLRRDRLEAASGDLGRFLAD